jgi:monoamine oxidase
MFHLAFCVRTSGSTDLRLYASSEELSRRFVGGSARIPIALAEGLGERVLVDAPVARVEQDRSEVRIMAIQIPLWQAI